MHELIDFCFDKVSNIYVVVTNYEAKWITDPFTKAISFHFKAISFKTVP